MSPLPRPGDIFPIPPNLRLKEAGVLILLYPQERAENHPPGRSDERDPDLSFYLTLRTNTVDTHKGQVSFPGGAQEPGESLEQTAVRETCEELGIESEQVQILDGPLTSLHIPVSNFRVTPFVGYMPVHPAIRPEPGEVVEVIETPLDLIVDDKTIVKEEWELRDRKAMVPYFAVNGHKVWGATAMILSEFREMLRQVNGIS